MTSIIKDSHLAHLYKVTDVASGRFYVGKHGGRTQSGYWGSGVLLQRHIKKHGRKNLKYEILVISDQKYIFDLEKAYIDDEFLKANPNCMNLVKGGMGGNLGGVPHNKGKKMSAEACLKLSIAKMGQPSPRKGKKHSPESIEKMRLSHKGAKQPASTGETLRKLFTGKTHQKVTCPHCNTVGGITGMSRWHFNNCRSK